MRQFIDVVNRLCESVYPENIEGQFDLGPVSYDQRSGLGNVPDNANVKYLGFAVLMTPDQFLGLVTKRADDIAYVTQQIENDMPIAAPWLSLRFDKNNLACVTSHEGRGRCMAIRTLYGNIPILVDCFPDGSLRARHLTIEMIAGFRNKAVVEKSRTTKAGPNCSEWVYWLDGWKDISSIP